MYYKQHAWKWVALIFLKVSVSVRIDKVFVSVCGKLVLFLFVEDRLFDLAYQHRVLRFSLRADHKEPVLSSCVCSGVRKNIPMAQSATIKIMNATTFENLDMVYPWNNLGAVPVIWGDSAMARQLNAGTLFMLSLIHILGRLVR